MGELKELMAEFDKDGNGEIDYQEFKSLMTVKIQNDNDYLTQAFKIFDRNGDGKISQVELRYVVMNLEAPPSDEKLDMMIKQVDANGDGYLSYVEFCSLMAMKAFNE